MAGWESMIPRGIVHAVLLDCGCVSVVICWLFGGGGIRVRVSFGLFELLLCRVQWFWG